MLQDITNSGKTLKKEAMFIFLVFNDFKMFCFSPPPSHFMNKIPKIYIVKEEFKGVQSKFHFFFNWIKILSPQILKEIKHYKRM